MISIEQFAQHLRKASRAAKPAIAIEAKVFAAAAAIKAQSYIGTLQGPMVMPGTNGVALLAGWAPLAESTQKEKRKLGFAGPNYDPLLRTGELLTSIHSFATADGGGVGSTSLVAKYQEIGTDKIPPRPFISRGLLEETPILERGLGRLSVDLLVPGRLIK